MGKQEFNNLDSRFCLPIAPEVPWQRCAVFNIQVLYKLSKEVTCKLESVV